MRLSTRTLYGTRLMIRLGLSYGGPPVLLKDIAGEEEMSEKYLSQIIIPLRSAGLINSFRGAHGGYILARSPRDISLGKIVNILEGGFGLMNGKAETGGDTRISINVTNDLWNNLSVRMSEFLESVSLEDLIGEFKKKEKNVLMYNI